MSWSWKEGGKEELDFAVESGNGRLASSGEKKKKALTEHSSLQSHGTAPGLL